MPLLVLMARLCPAGAEGTTYALVTSVQMVSGATGPQQLHPSCHPHPPTTFPNLHATNLHKLGNLGSQVGGTVGGIFSQVATSAFGVTNTDFSALWRLTVLTSVGRLVSPRLPATCPDLGSVCRGAGRGGQALSSGCHRHPRSVRGRARLGARAGGPCNGVTELWNETRGAEACCVCAVVVQLYELYWHRPWHLRSRHTTKLCLAQQTQAHHLCSNS